MAIRSVFAHLLLQKPDVVSQPGGHWGLLALRLESESRPCGSQLLHVLQKSYLYSGELDLLGDQISDSSISLLWTSRSLIKA